MNRKTLKSGALVLGLAILSLAGLAGYMHLQGPGDPAAIRLQAGDTRLVGEGRELYGDYCASCHGVALEGEKNWRVRTADGRLPAPPHDQSGHTWHHHDAQLFELTKYGPARIIGGNYESDMPGFEDILEDREIIAILSYIKSTWPADVRRRHDAINANAAQAR